MKFSLKNAPVLSALLLAGLAQQAALARESGEGHVDVPMPPHFRVVSTELDGPVFADAHGRTLYRWPFKNLRVGNTGDARDESNCTDVKTTESAGFMSPYPGGLVLPDLDTRPSCAQVWPPALAPADAKPVGKWTTITRKDGSKQWAYDGSALYTSVLDHQPGDVMGADTYEHRGDDPAVREPVKPPSDLPPGFTVATTRVGRLLLNSREYSIYYSDRDGPDESRCDLECTKTWTPMLAPASARPHGPWSIFERSPGVKQWAYDKKPLYQYSLDSFAHSFQGSDEPGWHNVLIQPAPPPPPGFTIQSSTIGEVLADAHGKTIYLYSCGDDSVDQLGCDHPTETQAYRFAMCGGGSPERCVRTFPYVLAARNAKSRSRTWTIIEIDPMTGHLAKPGAPGSLRVWAYRDRPVYTYAGDRGPGDVNADGMGEFRGEREGFKAFWVRDDFYKRAG